MERPQETEVGSTLQEARDEIAQDRRLARYYSTLRSVLNLAYGEAEGVRNGFSREKGAGFMAADAARVGVSFVPVAGQIAAAAIEGATMIAGIAVRNADEARANAMIEVNPTCSRMEWEKFTDQLAATMTLAKRDEILNCDGSEVEQGSGLMQKVADIFRRRKTTLTPDKLAIKGMATEDASLFLAEIYKGFFKEMTADGEGIENEEIRNAMILHCGRVIGCNLDGQEFGMNEEIAPSEQGMAFSSSPTPSSKITPRDHPAAHRVQATVVMGRGGDDD